MTISGGELLVNLLKACGVEYIFCSPGTEWTPVWEVLVKNQGLGDNSLKYINCRHEILAVSMAQGYAETTGKLPAVILHASVGPLNGALAIRNARSARVPMIILSGEAYQHRGDEEVRPQGWHWLGLLSDIGGPPALIKEYVKWSNPVKSRDSLVDSILRGCRIALAAPRGPVFLSVPTDILLKSGPEIEFSQTSPVPAIIEPANSVMQKAARQLIESKYPVIIGEHAGKKPRVVQKLIELAELLSIPVFESGLSYASNFPKDHPLYMGYDLSESIKQADTVLVVGGLTPWYPPSEGPGDKAKVIMLDEAPLHERLPYWGYRMDLPITGDIEKGLEFLINAVRNEIAERNLSGSLYNKKLSFWQTKHDTMVAGWENEALACREESPINPRWFLYTARKTFPDNAIVLDETLMHTRLVHQYVSRPDCYIKSAYGGLGVSLGEAAGVKLANPERPVIVLVGDGSFNYNPVLAALGLCQEYQIPLLIIIMNNGGYRAMKMAHRMRYPEGAAVRRNQFLGTDITPPPDYVKVAEAFGFSGEKLEDPEDIEAALKHGLSQIAMGKTALLNAIIT